MGLQLTRYATCLEGYVNVILISLEETQMLIIIIDLHYVQLQFKRRKLRFQHFNKHAKV